MHKLCKAILEEANSLLPAEGFIYLIELYASLQKGSQLVNSITGENGTNIVLSWLSEYLPTIQVPPDYFETATSRLLDQIHPFMHDIAKEEILRQLSPLSKEEARAHLRLTFSDEQFTEVYRQVQVWIAMHEARTSVN